MPPLLLVAALLSSAAASDLDALCTWSGARWEHAADLRFPGTGTAFAHVGFTGDTRVDGTLGYDLQRHLRFRVDLRGEGFEIGGDVDYNGDQLFRLSKGTLPLGKVGVLVPNAMLRVNGSRGDAVVVGPVDFALDRVSVWGASSTASCERITVHRRQSPDPEQMLEAAGFPGDLPERVLPPHRGAVLKETPAGPRLARIRPSRYGARVYLVQERDGLARIALPHWTGVVWTGWVPARKLELPEEAGGGGVFGIGGRGTGSEPVAVRRCDNELPLFASAGSRTERVGTIHAGTPIRLEEPGGGPEGYRSANFPGGWVHAVEKSVLLVPEVVLECRETTWEHGEPLEGLLAPPAGSAGE